ncbi:hypothetical protein DMUE_1821 [Dictyocoela muelleri]|nr:hypothetical protein DMUE_1821 [Dictyocoela muelleri]
MNISLNLQNSKSIIKQLKQKNRIKIYTSNDIELLCCAEIFMQILKILCVEHEISIIHSPSEWDVLKRNIQHLNENHEIDTDDDEFVRSKDNNSKHDNNNQDNFYQNNFNQNNFNQNNSNQNNNDSNYNVDQTNHYDENMDPLHKPGKTIVREEKTLNFMRFFFGLGDENDDIFNNNKKEILHEENENNLHNKDFNNEINVKRPKLNINEINHSAILKSSNEINKSTDRLNKSTNNKINKYQSENILLPPSEKCKCHKNSYLITIYEILKAQNLIENKIIWPILLHMDFKFNFMHYDFCEECEQTYQELVFEVEKGNSKDLNKNYNDEIKFTHDLKFNGIYYKDELCLQWISTSSLFDSLISNIHFIAAKKLYKRLNFKDPKKLKSKKKIKNGFKNDFNKDIKNDFNDDFNNGIINDKINYKNENFISLTENFSSVEFKVSEILAKLGISLKNAKEKFKNINRDSKSSIFENFDCTFQFVRQIDYDLKITGIESYLLMNYFLFIKKDYYVFLNDRKYLEEFLKNVSFFYYELGKFFLKNFFKLKQNRGVKILMLRKEDLRVFMNNEIQSDENNKDKENYKNDDNYKENYKKDDGNFRIEILFRIISSYFDVFFQLTKEEKSEYPENIECDELNFLIVYENNDKCILYSENLISDKLEKLNDKIEIEVLDVYKKCISISKSKARKIIKILCL